LALAAGGADPRAVKKQGASPLDFLASQAGNWSSATDYERTLLAVTAAGMDPRSFAGMDLVAKVQSFQRGEGNIGDAVNSNAFGILAYKSTGVDIPPGAVQWQRRAQNPDGGWGNNPGAASNPDMTAASIMALKAAGAENGDPALASALAFLHSTQNPDGGFSFQSGASDVSATAWCAQAIMAVGQDPASAEWSSGGNTPLSFLASMQAADGHFVWMKGREMNPVWTTAYAVCALAGKPYPVGVFHAQTPAPASPGGSDAGSGNAPAVNEGESGGGAPGGTENTAAGGEAAAGEGVASPEQQAEEPAIESAVPENEEAEAVAETEEEGETGKGFPLLLLLAIVFASASVLSLAGWLIHRRLLHAKQSG
jgi:hypothetical protein